VGAIFGYSHTAGGYDGGQAEYVRVPYADVGPTVIPSWMDPDDAVLLTDVVPTGYQAAEMGGIQKGDTVVGLRGRARWASWPPAAPGCSARAG
jgi:threonine dehydrogenase-like Zn-dependent dehydrogenase